MTLSQEHVLHVVCFWPLVSISTPVSVILVINQYFFFTMLATTWYTQESFFKLSAALAIHGRSSPIIGPMDVAPVMSEIEHLGDKFLVDLQWLVDNVRVLS
jgi:hypothetical protein